MGKIKQRKFKCHTSAPVSMDTGDLGNKTSPQITNTTPEQVPVSLPVKNNVFKNLVIPLSVLKQELPNSFAETKEEKTEKIEKSRRYDPISMDIRKLLASQKKLSKKKRLTVAQLVEQYKKEKQDEKKKLKKKRKAILGEWKSLMDSLSDPTDSKKKESSQGNSSKQKRKKVESQMSDSMALFSSALQGFEWNSEV